MSNYHAIEKILTDFKNGATYSDSIEKMEKLIHQTVARKHATLPGTIKVIMQVQGNGTRVAKLDRVMTLEMFDSAPPIMAERFFEQAWKEFVNSEEFRIAKEAKR